MLTKKIRVSTKITVYGTNNKDVVPFDTYLAILLSASYKSESFHVFFLGQTRCEFKWSAGASASLGRVVTWVEWSDGSPGFAWVRVGPMVAGVSMLVARVWVWVRWLLGFEHVGTLSVLCLCFVGA